MIRAGQELGRLKDWTGPERCRFDTVDKSGHFDFYFANRHFFQWTSFLVSSIVFNIISDLKFNFWITLKCKNEIANDLYLDE